MSLRNRKASVSEETFDEFLAEQEDARMPARITPSKNSSQSSSPPRWRSRD